jgi:CBS domain-containing protein
MSKGVVSASVRDSIKHVAARMRDEDIGAMPVMENDRPVGMITDRDIVITCVADGHSLDESIEHAMSREVVSVKQDQDLEEVSRLMAERQISRVLVVDDGDRPVGMIGLQDLSQKNERLAGDTVTEIKQ